MASVPRGCPSPCGSCPPLAVSSAVDVNTHLAASHLAAGQEAETWRGSLAHSRLAAGRYPRQASTPAASPGGWQCEAVFQPVCKVWSRGLELRGPCDTLVLELGLETPALPHLSELGACLPGVASVPRGGPSGLTPSHVPLQCLGRVRGSSGPRRAVARSLEVVTRLPRPCCGTRVHGPGSVLLTWGETRSSRCEGHRAVTRLHMLASPWAAPGGGS